MSPVQRAARWLRANAERALSLAVEEELAARYLRRPGPAVPRRWTDLFWRRVFVPVYRMLPWRLRLSIMRAMPGSHRKPWRGGSTVS